MGNPRELKVRCNSDCLTDLNDYLAAFQGAKASDNIGENNSNEIFLNSMPNRWSKQAYVQGFDCETITEKSVDIFELIEILEAIYEGVVEP